MKKIKVLRELCALAVNSLEGRNLMNLDWQASLGFWDLKHGLDSNVCGQTVLLLSKRFQNIDNPFPETGISRLTYLFSHPTRLEAKTSRPPEWRGKTESFNKRKRPLQRLSSDNGQCTMYLNIRGSHLKLQNFSWLNSPELRRSKADKLWFKPGNQFGLYFRNNPRTVPKSA